MKRFGMKKIRIYFQTSASDDVSLVFIIDIERRGCFGKKQEQRKDLDT